MDSQTETGYKCAYCDKLFETHNEHELHKQSCVVKMNQDLTYALGTSKRAASRIIKECESLLSSKAYDHDKNHHSNLKISEALAKEFPEPYKIYIMLIGTKLARLGNLLSKSGQNESIEDSFPDLINYLVLMAERYQEERKSGKSNEV